MTNTSESPSRAGYQVGLTLAKHRKLAVVVIIIFASLLYLNKLLGEYTAASIAKEKAEAEAASKARIENSRAARLKATEEARALARAQMTAAIAKKDYDGAISAGAPFADLPDPEMTMLHLEASARLSEARAQQAKLKADADRKADLARRKREGVALGMTQQQVLESNWGRPSRVNRTSTARGTHEQWVYSDGRGYLYFQDGILTAVQN